ncbi:MAG: caspase family protein [Phycisphaerales bacterium]
MRTPFTCFGLVTATLITAAAVAAQPPATAPDVRRTDPSGTQLFDALQIKPPRTQVAAVGKRYALLVGVEQAEVGGTKQNPLAECPGDSIAMGAALTAAGYECVVINDGSDNQGKIEPGRTMPTVANCRAAVQKLCAQAGPNDQVLIYFSTHGIILPGKNGLDGPAILAMNDGALKIDDVKAAMAGSKALTRILLLDCCRDNKAFAPKVSEFRDVHVVSACRPEEISMTGNHGLSIFTEAFVAGITDCRADRYKDGQIELDELLSFVIDEVPKRARERDAKASQNPTRTVVDPRTVNPIIASCSRESIFDGLVPTAMQGPVQALPRNDLVLSGSIAGKIAIGMSEAEMAAAMGRAPDDAANCDKDPSGDGLAMYMNTPKKGDTVFVFFGNKKVNRVFLMYEKLCDGEFDAAKTRAALAKLLDGKDLTEIGAVIGQPTAKELFAKLGCPKSGLMYGQDNESGSVSYDDVPLPGQQLTFLLKEGKVTDIHLHPMPKWAK